jgi:hypothetical protein
MKVASMIHRLGFKSDLKAAASHTEVHRVHVYIPRVFLKSLSSINIWVLLFNIFIRITCYLSRYIAEIRNAYVTNLTGVYILKFWN